LFTSKSKIRRTKNVNSFVYNPRMVKPTIYVGSDNEFCETLPVWPDGKIIYSIFGLLAQWKFGKNHLKFAKVGSNFWQIQYKLFQNRPRLYEFCQISPNLVTLVPICREDQIGNRKEIKKLFQIWGTQFGPFKVAYFRGLFWRRFLAPILNVFLATFGRQY